MKKNHYYTITICFVLSMLLLASPLGCTGNKGNVKKDPFFDKWKARAEKSKGYSPSARKRTLDLPDKTTKRGPGQDIRVETEKLLPTRKTTIKMKAVDVAVLLRALARAADQNIMINEKVKGMVDINIKEAPWDQVFRSVLRTNGLTYAWEGNIIRIMTAEDMEQDLKRESQKRGLKLVAPLVTRIISVDYADAGKLQENLEKFLANNKEGKPIGSVMVDEHTNSLIIQAIREDIKRMIPIIEELDRPTPQILIEAHIVEATSTTARELGIEWGGLHHGGTHNWVTAGSNSSDVLGKSLATGIDPISGTAAYFPAALQETAGMTIGYVSENIGKNVLSVQLSALQTEGKLNILSSPSITTIDNQKAIIESGKEIPYQIKEDNEVNIEYKKAVLSLEVTPHVIDGKTLKMNIKTTKDEPDFANKVGDHPVLTTKKAETNVILRDGQTTVIGGLNTEKTNKRDYGTPFLMKIPLLGWLFKGKSDKSEMDDVLIFITPHILKEHVANEADFKQIEKVVPTEGSSGPEAIPPS